LQAELRDLEPDLQKYAKADDVSDDPDRKVFSFDWLALKKSCKDHVEEGNDGHQ